MARVGSLLILALSSLVVGEALAQTPVPAWTFEGDQAGAHLGASVSSAGDTNGDGYSDVIVGVPHHDNGEGDEGSAYLFLGSAAGLSRVPVWTHEGGRSGARFGQSVASAGDVNGDGYGDVLVGAPGYGDAQGEEGAAFVYLGSANGLSSTPARVWVGQQPGARFGASVGGAGDVNADGLDDLLVGAPGFDGGDVDEGAAFLFFGAASGLPSMPGWSGEGNQVGALFGSSVAALGDMNGDGYDDIAVSAPLFDGGQVDEGQVRVFAGSSLGPGATPLQSFEANVAGSQFGHSLAGGGDLSGSGTPRILFGAPIYHYTHVEEGGTFLGALGQTPFFLDFGRQDFAHRGSSIALAGDVNGDGLGDVVIGADRYDNGEEDEGLVTVHVGHPSFVVDRTPAWSLDLDQPFSAFGSSVASAGDVNGDGYDDVIIGAPLYDNGQTDEGGAFVFLGPSGDVTGVGQEPATRPTVAAPRLAARPNPFAEFSSLSFQLERPARVRLDVFDPSGRLVERLVDGSLPAGRREVVWSVGNRGAASGIYFARLWIDGTVFTRRLLRLR